MSDSFVFYRSFYEAIRAFPEGCRLEIYDAIVQYALDGKTEGEISNVAKAILTMAAPQIDANRKRKENGKKGGRPAAEKPLVIETETIGFESENHRLEASKPNVNVNVNVNDNVNGIKKKNIKKKNAAFVPPTVDEVRQYIADMGYQYTDPDSFVNFYTSKNWMVGKTKMVDWKASLRGWESREKKTAAGRAAQKKNAFHNFDARDTEYDDMLIFENCRGGARES